jgi:predicted nucleic acid-binding protein
VKLVDTSVWVDFFRGRARADRLSEHLDANEVLLHPWVLGELALGHLGSKRTAILGDLQLLPTAPLVEDAAVLAMVDTHRLDGCGLGWVDAHLLASAERVGAAVWTWDARLARAAATLRIASG